MEIESENCAICLYKIKSNRIILECKHTFCVDCILNLILKQSNKFKFKCPMCRADIYFSLMCNYENCRFKGCMKFDGANYCKKHYDRKCVEFYEHTLIILNAANNGGVDT